MRRVFARINDWMTDPDHNRILPVVMLWTMVTAALTVVFITNNRPVVATGWAVLTFANLFILIRAILD